MKRSILSALAITAIWTQTTMAQFKCDAQPVTAYKDAVKLMMQTLDEPGPGRWWRGEPQSAGEQQLPYDFQIVNNNGRLAVQVRPSTGPSLFFNGATLNATACKSDKPNDPQIRISIDTSQYYGKWSDVNISKVRSDLHVNWDGQLALLRPAQ